VRRRRGNEGTAPGELANASPRQSAGPDHLPGLAYRTGKPQGIGYC
jgi:hypothetical protein